MLAAAARAIGDCARPVTNCGDLVRVALASVADRTGRRGNGLGMGTAVSSGSLWRNRARTRGGRSRHDCDGDADHPRVSYRIRPFWCWDRLLVCSRATGSRSGMDRLWCALGDPPLHLPAVARAGRPERPCDTVVGPGRRMGDRYRRLRDRKNAWWPAARTALEPAQNLDGARWWRGMCRARRLGDCGMAWDFSGLAAGAPQCGPCDCRAV